MNDFICANCMHGKKYRADCEWEYMYDGTDYANDCCYWWRPTNADRIRAMTDEELAEFMNCGACPPGKDVSELCYDEDGGSVPDMCNLCWLAWLKEEAT